MKLVTYQQKQSKAIEIGVLLYADKYILPLHQAAEIESNTTPRYFDSMLALIQSGEQGINHAKRLIKNSEKESLIEKSTVTLLAPLPRPEQIRDFMAFEGHAAYGETEPLPKEYYQIPVYYKANRFSVAGHESVVNWPHYSDVIDYELEFAIIIGKQGKDISKAKARDYIFGYTIFNDFSARDAQAKEMVLPLGPAKGKDFDGGNVFGPCIVTADEISDPYQLSMTAKVNGELWSDGNSSMITHTFEDMIAHVSQSETLYPGEIICSGTVTSGCGLELEKYLQRGDRIELSVEGIGILANSIA